MSSNEYPRFVCVELPQEAIGEDEKDKDMVGWLQMSLYGTRDAAANFQEEVRKFMVKHGFRRGLYNVSTYCHEKKNIKTLAHGDDFVSSGDRQDIKWFQSALESRFQVKTKIVGRGKDEAKESTMLNRSIRISEKD